MERDTADDNPKSFRGTRRLQIPLMGSFAGIFALVCAEMDEALTNKAYRPSLSILANPVRTGNLVSQPESSTAIAVFANPARYLFATSVSYLAD
jgi:hypothetical protein